MSATPLSVDVGDATLCVHVFGHDGDPTLLLIGGAASSMDYWEDDFCRRLTSAGRRVIRYDTRDTGQSTAYPVGEPGYGADDLVSDAVAVLDAVRVRRAHVVGISMGGGIAQRLALSHPDRLESLTLMSTTPIGPTDHELPGMHPDVAAMFEAPAAEPDWSDRAAAIDAIVQGERPFAGSVSVDESAMRRLAAVVVDRTISLASTMTNHWILDGGTSPDERAARIDTPTLVMHGTDDPLFPLAHGLALAAEIPGARFVPLTGMGHQYPPRSLWDLVVTSLAEHTANRS